MAPLFYVTRFIVILQHFQVLFLGGIGDQLLLPLSCSQFDLQEAWSIKELCTMWMDGWCNWLCFGISHSWTHYHPMKRQFLVGMNPYWAHAMVQMIILHFGFLCTWIVQFFNLVISFQYWLWIGDLNQCTRFKQWQKKGVNDIENCKEMLRYTNCASIF